MRFRVNQRVCRVAWKKSQPYLRIGLVTKVTTQTYYVDNATTPSAWWFRSWQRAVKAEYLDLFRWWDTLLGEKLRPEGWTIEDTVVCVCVLRRLERRLQRRYRREGETE